MNRFLINSRVDSFESHPLRMPVVISKQFIRKTPKPEKSRYFKKEQIPESDEYLIAKTLKLTERDIIYNKRFSLFPKLMPSTKIKAKTSPAMYKPVTFDNIQKYIDQSTFRELPSKSSTPELKNPRTKF